MGLEFSKFLGGDKPLIKFRCVFINHSNGVVVGTDGTDGYEEEEEEEEDVYRNFGCMQWRRKEKTRATVMRNESVEN
jgi:hypothetical protein